jgi:hypothetical protein
MIMYCEKCGKSVKKLIKVNWLNFPKGDLHFKKFDSFEKLIEWIETDGKDKQVILKVVSKGES